MKKTTLNKTVVSTALISMIGLTCVPFASANDTFGPNGGTGYGYCGNSGYQGRNLSDKDAKAYKQYRDETSPIRKDLLVKNSELGAINRQNNPDAKRVATLTGEIYDLQESLDKKAEEAGFTRGSGDRLGMHNGWGYGHGMMGTYGQGYGPGMMSTYGRSHGPGMMDDYGQGYDRGMMGNYRQGYGPGMMNGQEWNQGDRNMMDR
ncbi:MAG: periplasmic heavy metal sensor [Proteobacteria bacterium]|nr:periplasmic heavy metal sensor [Pseudomonadota bacterium]MBU1687581.1 periplasmic heavy metal sensor [Pseudomonadota bacterium]